MRPLVTCLMTALCLAVVRGDEAKDQTCFEACTPYFQWGYDCARLAPCFDLTEGTADDDCYDSCMHSYGQCSDLCEEHHDDFTTLCATRCKDSTFDSYCKSQCFVNEFRTQYYAELPPLTSHDVGVGQGIPFFENSEEAGDD